MWNGFGIGEYIGNNYISKGFLFLLNKNGL